MELPLILSLLLLIIAMHTDFLPSLTSTLPHSQQGIMSSTIPNKERQNRVTFAIDLEKPNAQAQAHLLKVEDCKDAVQNLSASLERFEVFGVDDHWCREKCEFIYEMLENWVDLLPTAHDLTGKWPTVHEFLIQHNALGPWSPKEPGVLTDSGVYLLLFAISNLLWKRLCEPLLVGATAEQRLLLKTTHNDLPMRDERTPRGKLEIHLNFLSGTRLQFTIQILIPKQNCFGPLQARKSIPSSSKPNVARLRI